MHVNDATTYIFPPSGIDALDYQPIAANFRNNFYKKQARAIDLNHPDQYYPASPIPR